MDSLNYLNANYFRLVLKNTLIQKIEFKGDLEWRNNNIFFLKFI